MTDSWERALGAYSYPVDLRGYINAKSFPGFFEVDIAGDRESTIAFENHYREIAPSHIESCFEVIYWKMYSQGSGARANKLTNKIVESVAGNGITARQLYDAIQQFVACQKIENLKQIRRLLGIKTGVLAVPLTLPALLSPETIPMIDIQVAKWVNSNSINHNNNRKNKLIPFRMNSTSLRENDFPSYLNWVAWCQEVGKVLTQRTSEKWRARDVEMAVFTAQREKMKLEVLP